MFRFFKKFEIVTVWDYTNDEVMHEVKNERQKQFDDIVKHFGIGWSQAKLSIEPYPAGMLRRGNIVKFGGKAAVKVTWKCIITPEKISIFCNEVNDYVKDKDYADFAVYGLP